MGQKWRSVKSTKGDARHPVEDNTSGYIRAEGEDDSNKTDKYVMEGGRDFSYDSDGK